jgi:thymidylate synthase
MGGSDQYDAHDMQRDLQEEFDELRTRNVSTKERVRKLNVIHRGLASRPATASKPNKYAHISGKLEVTHTKVTHQYQKLAEDLRAQMVVNQREVLRL